MNGSNSTAATRDDFSPQVKRVLAQRAALRCSRCHASTSGPRVHTESSLNVGVAAHITAAAAGGARYDQSLSREARRSAANGIWLCQNCAKLVDNDAIRFPENRLRGWKSRRETLALEHIGRADDGFAQVGHDRLRKPAFLLPNTHRSNPFFLRSPEVARGLDAFKPGDVLVLHGLGGAGKTQQAVQFAHERQESYGNVLFASATSVNALYESLATLADSQQTAVIVETNAPTRVKVRSLFDWLASEPTTWLLVLDNADSTDVAREIEQLLPPAHVGHVIITSRLTKWTPAFRTQAVNVWTNTEAAAFLMQRMTIDRTTDELEALGTALGGLPLALEQAAAYINQTRVSVRDYLRLLKTHNTSLLARHEPGLTDYPASVATTWLVTIRRLSTVSTDMMSLIACFSSEPIPKDLFRDLEGDHPFDVLTRAKPKPAEPSSPDSIRLALSDLATYSLITLSEDDLRMHPLLQVVVHDLRVRLPWHYGILRHIYALPDRKIWARAYWPLCAAGLMSEEGMLPWPGFGDVGIFEMKKYAPHVDAILSQLPKEVRDRAAVGRLEHLMRCYGDQLSAYESGVELLLNMLAVTVERVPLLKPETDWFKSNLEELYGRAVGAGRGDHLACKLRRLPDAPYHLMRELARGIAASGDSPTARRLFRFCRDHAIEDPRSRIDLGLAYIDEAFYVPGLSDADCMLLLEEGLSAFEKESQLSNFRAVEGICLYNAKAQTAQHKQRVLTLLEQAIPGIIQFMRLGVSVGFHAAQAYLELLEELDTIEKALRECEQFLRVTARPDKPGRGHRNVLWASRGTLLIKSGRIVPAARCFAHAVALRRRYLSSEALEEANLHYLLGKAYLDAGQETLGVPRLKVAAEKLDDGWNKNPEYAEILAALVGIHLGRSHQITAGETLLRCALSSRRDRIGANAQGLASIHRLFGIFLHDVRRLPEAEIELRRALLLIQSGSGAEKQAQQEDVLRYSSSLTAVLEELRDGDRPS